MSENQPPSPSYIQEGTAENFSALVLDNSTRGPVLVNYWSPKAGPYLRLYPVLDKVIRGLQGRMLLVNLDTDQHARLVRDYGVTSVPTMKVFEQREVVETLHGFHSEPELRRVLSQYVAQASDVAIGRALQIYNLGQHDRALTLLAETAMQDPQNLRVPLTLAKLLMREDRLEQAQRLLITLPLDQRTDARVQEMRSHLDFILTAREALPVEELDRRIKDNPQDLEARYQWAALWLVNDDYEAALIQMLEITRRDGSFHNHIGRKGMLAIFKLLGHDHELVAKYKPKMTQYTH